MWLRDGVAGLQDKELYVQTLPIPKARNILINAGPAQWGEHKLPRRGKANLALNVEINLVV